MRTKSTRFTINLCVNLWFICNLSSLVGVCGLVMGGVFRNISRIFIYLCWNRSLLEVLHVQIEGTFYPSKRIQITIVLVIIFSRYWSKSIIRCSIPHVTVH